MFRSKLIDILFKKSGAAGRRLMVLATAAGIFQALVVVVINSSSEKMADELNVRHLLMFAVAIAGFIVTKRLTLFGASEYMYQVVYEMRLRIVDKIRKADLKSFEQTGKDRIATTLNQSADIIFEATKSLAHASSAAVMLFFSFIYIYVLSVEAFIMSVALIMWGIYHFLGTSRKIEPRLKAANAKEADFHKGLTQLLDGFKEVKMSSSKGADLFDNRIKAGSKDAQSSKLKAEIMFIKNNLFVQIFFFMLIAAVVYALPQLTELNNILLRNLIAVLLFCIGSIVSVVQVIPMLSKSDAALNSLAELEELLDRADDMKHTFKSSVLSEKGDFDQISFEKLTFRYSSKRNNNTFVLGPLDLALQPGEVVFLTGGNGSGKSTLLKLIAGLYYPLSGKVLCDAKVVDPTTYAHYRNLFSVIFTDFHLFDRLYGLERIDETTVNQLLKQMELDHVTSFEGDRFSSTNLSTGQRKRLALIAAYLEERQIMVFDEVAADQDPVFRDYFYNVLLRDLKNQGKTVVAATHDDRYFHVADRVVKMEFGKLVD